MTLPRTFSRLLSVDIAFHTSAELVRDIPFLRAHLADEALRLRFRGTELPVDHRHRSYNSGSLRSVLDGFHTRMEEMQRRAGFQWLT